MINSPTRQVNVRGRAFPLLTSSMSQSPRLLPRVSCRFHARYVLLYTLWPRNKLRTNYFHYHVHWHADLGIHIHTYLSYYVVACVCVCIRKPYCFCSLNPCHHDLGQICFLDLGCIAATVQVWTGVGPAENGPRKQVPSLCPVGDG